MMPELFMADAVGATGKPLIRVHTAGSVGGSTAIVAASLVQSGKYQRVLTMAWEKQSESNAMWALSIPVPFTKPVGAGAGGYFAPHVRSYIRRSGAPTHIGAMVAVKDRLNGAQEPAGPPAPARHHAGEGDGVPDAVGPDPFRRDLPVLRRRLRDGDRQRRDRRRACRRRPPRRVDPRHGAAHRTAGVLRPRPGQPAGRPRRRGRAVEGRGHHHPHRRDRRRRDLRAVLLVRADVAGEPRLRARGRGLEAHRGRRNRDRRAHPVQRVRRRAVVQSHRRVGHDPVRRVRDPGDGQGRGPSGRGCPQGAGPRVRRWLAVLLDVGGRLRQARSQPAAKP